MLRWRLLLGTLIIAALVALCWLDDRAAVAGAWLLPLGVIGAVMATKESLDLAVHAGMTPLRAVVYLGNVLLACSSWLGMLARGEAWRDAAPLAALAAGVLAVFLFEMRRYERPGKTLTNLAAGVFTLVYVGLMLSFAVQLRLAWGVGALAAWVIVVKMGDTGAYTVGRLVGRHKMAPKISPGKTWEGAAGALLFSCIGSWAAFRWLIPACTSTTVAPGPWWGWLAFGLLLGATGMLADLAESLLKRDVGRKDSSDWLPGFGGVLDILDSLLLSAPVAWFCWASGMVGR